MSKLFCVAGIVAGVMAMGSVAHADSLLDEQSELNGGIIVALDFGDGAFLSSLTADGKFTVQGLVESEADVEKTRNAIKQKGLYGKISCNRYNGKELPYIDNLINVLLCKSSCKVPPQELMRVVAPGGAVMLQGPNGWKKAVKPEPDGMDEWNQFLHGADNNGVSMDDVGPPRRLRWHDAPEFGRSKSIAPSFTSMVSARGVVFTIEDRATTEDVNAPVNYVLTARDAFNGVQLWQLPMKQWDQWQTESIKFIPTQQQRSLAAIGKRVYCCPEFGGPVTAYNYRAGRRTRVYRGTEQTAEFAIESKVLFGIKGSPYKMPRNSATVGAVELFSLNLSSGRILWKKNIDTQYAGGTLAVNGNRLVYYSEAGLTCLDAASGKTLWTESAQMPAPAKPPKKGKSRKKKKAATNYSIFDANTHPTIVLTDDAVFCAIGDDITAMDLADGKTIWTAEGGTNYRKSPDLFVADGLLWSKDLNGRDLKTGKVVRTIAQEITGPMSHDRCYRNRITHRYYLNSASGGTDFLELNGKSESPNPWVRSTCGLAVMPANGMLYNGPYVCQCAIGAMITGVNGLYNGTGNSARRFTVKLQPRLVKGPVYGNLKLESGNLKADDWATYRSTSMRSGVAAASAPAAVSQKWKVNIGTHPTAPVVAGGSVYVADRDACTLHALNRETGETRWTFTADGRIDSPPTYHKGLVLFGSRCGWTYCLRASDGRLVWRFNGLPERRLVSDNGRLESAWPVNGSVMIYQDTAYFAAGRSSFLDGGIGLFGLDPVSGKMKYGKIVQGPYQDNKRNFPVLSGGTFQMEGFRSGIFSNAGNELFIRHQAFTPELEYIKPDDVKTLHLMASPGFLNDSPQHRTYWTVDQTLRYGGPTGKFGTGPAGDTVAYDGKLFYEVRGYPPGRNLMGRGRDLNQLEIYSVYSGRLTGVGKAKKAAIPAVGDWEKRWNTPTPFAGHALAVSKNTLLAAGVPMLEGYSKEEINAAYAGEKGGIAWLLDTESGNKLQELRFEAAPVWDGIAIAHGSYFICLKDGSVICLSRK